MDHLHFTFGRRSKEAAKLFDAPFQTISQEKEILELKRIAEDEENERRAIEQDEKIKQMRAQKQQQFKNLM